MASVPFFGSLSLLQEEKLVVVGCNIFLDIFCQLLYKSGFNWLYFVNFLFPEVGHFLSNCSKDWKIFMFTIFAVLPSASLLE